MRHRRLSKKLDRTSAERIALLRSLVKSLFIYESITTTTRKAKEARRLAEKLITLAKVDTVASRRRVYSVLQDRTITTNLFKDIAVRFKERPGGYTRIIHYSNRLGDGARLAILELVERKVKQPPKLKKKELSQERPQEEIGSKEEPKKPKEEIIKEEKKVIEKPHIPKEEPHKKDILKEEKPKKTGIVGNLRKFFRRKTIG